MRRLTQEAVDAAARELWRWAEIDGRDMREEPMPPFERNRLWWMIRAEAVLAAAMTAESE